MELLVEMARGLLWQGKRATVLRRPLRSHTCSTVHIKEASLLSRWKPHTAQARAELRTADMGRRRALVLPTRQEG